MFRFESGDTPEVLSRKKGLLREALLKWNLVPTEELATARNAHHLADLVALNEGIARSVAGEQVDGWLAGLVHS